MAKCNTHVSTTKKETEIETCDAFENALLGCKGEYVIVYGETYNPTLISFSMCVNDMSTRMEILILNQQV